MATVLNTNLAQSFRPNLNRTPIFPNLLNIRDLGGYPTRSGEQTRWKSLLRSDELERLTPEGAQALLDYGVNTIIDLRWPAEVEVRPSVFQTTSGQVRYVNISLLGESEEAWRFIHPRTTKEMWNCVVLDYCQREIGAVMRAVTEAPAGGILFHCQSGKDRTGIIAALLLALADVEPEAIAEDYALTTHNLREAYLAGATPDEHADVLERVRCPPEQIHNMLAHLEATYGGLLGYLQKIGLKENEIAQIKRKLRP